MPVNNIDFLSEIKRAALPILDENDHMFLYGSRARGDNTMSSDWDMIIITKACHSEDKAFDKYVYPLVLFGQQREQDVSVMVFSMTEWEERKMTPFYRNVMKDRIEII